jgi:hypothetical protein
MQNEDVKDRPSGADPDAAAAGELSQYVRNSMRVKVAALREQAVQMLGLFDDGAPRK